MERDRIYLQEIEEFCRKVIAFTASVRYEDFVADEKLQLAVVKLVENIGEAAKRLSETTRARHPNVDWHKVMAMRNRLVHDYMDIDLAIVHDVAVNEIPMLLKNLHRGV